MDYQEFSGATVSGQDEAFAQEFANFVNGRMCSADKTGRELTRAHRYLQQQMFKVFIGFMRAVWRTITKMAFMTNATSGLHGSLRKRTNI